MKIGIVTDCLSRFSGGLFDSIRGQAMALRAMGIEVNVFGVEDLAIESDLPKWNPLHPVVCKSAGPSFFNFSPNLKKALQEYDPDLVEVHGLWKYTSVAALKWKHSTRRPTLIHPHGMLDPWALRNSRWKKKLASYLYESAHLKKANYLRALCESEAKSIRELGLKNPIAVVPNGINMPDIDPRVTAPWIRSMEPGRKVLLYLGRLHPKKNLAELVRAWATIQHDSKSQEWILAICGWGQTGYEEELKRLATDLGLAWEDGNNLEDPLPIAKNQSRPISLFFSGPLFDEKKNSAYFHSDAFILPSLSEGLPMVVLEAWAHGLPVVITPECNLPEGVAADAAFLTGPTAADIFIGLKTLFSLSDQQRGKMGNLGRDMVLDKFSWESVAHKMRLLYDHVLDGGDIPPKVTLNSRS